MDRSIDKQFDAAAYNLEKSHCKDTEQRTGRLKIKRLPIDLTVKNWLRFAILVGRSSLDSLFLIALLKILTNLN